MDLVRNYFRDVWQLLRAPTEFFKRMPLNGGFSGPLAFALVTHWLGAAIEFLWNSLIGGAVQGYMDDLTRVFSDVSDIDHPGRSAVVIEMRDKILHWMWGTGSVIVDPFTTLASIFFTSLFVFVGARLLVTPGRNGAPQEITFESALRIVCFGMTPAILAAIPLAGSVIASIFVAVVTIIGARTVYRVDTGRAAVIALFPKILLLGAVFGALFFAALFVLKLVATAF